MYTYKLHKSNATPVLSSRAHLGAHKRAAPFRSMFSCTGEEGNIGMLVWGGRGARGRGGGGTDSHRCTLGAHLWVHTEGPPPPPRW